MKVIIAGSRSIRDADALNEAYMAFESVYGPITEIISGGAVGVDTMGELLAFDLGVQVKVFPAQWDVYGRAAGIIRNTQMARYADGLIALWDGESRGTRHMIMDMQKRDKPILAILVDTA